MDIKIIISPETCSKLSLALRNAGEVIEIDPDFSFAPDQLRYHMNKTGMDLDLLILTDSPAVCREAKSRNICCIGLEEENGVCLDDAWSVLMLPCDPSPEWLKMQLCHYNNTSYTLYERTGLRIRESILEDFPQILDLLEKTDQSHELSGQLDTEWFLAYTERSYRMWGYGMWTVEKSEGEKTALTGWCGLYTSALDAGGVELGYVLDPSVWGRGIGQEVCRVILRFANEHLGIDEFFLQTRSGNSAAEALAKKLGFREADQQGRLIRDVQKRREDQRPQETKTEENSRKNPESPDRRIFKVCVDYET